MIDMYFVTAGTNVRETLAAGGPHKQVLEWTKSHTSPPRIGELVRIAARLFTVEQVCWVPPDEGRVSMYVYVYLKEW